MADKTDDRKVYIIDEDYRLIYFDEKLKKIFPEVECGDFCYQRFCGDTEPCFACPVKENWEGQSIFYNHRLNRWLDVAASRVIWPTDGKEYRWISACETENGGESALDVLTGLYKRKAFCRYAELFLQRKQKNWCMVALDIEHFKIYNEWFGQEKGDKLLGDIGRFVNQVCKEEQGMTGYFGDDDFFLLIPYDEEKIAEIQSSISQLVLENGGTVGFFPVLGVYQIEKGETDVNRMCDKAQIAVLSIKGNFSRRIAVYDSAMMEQLENRKLLLADVQKGIENGEFTFYLQPECDICTGKIVSMEALTRWEHPERGLVSPAEFVPALEEMGLITNLDMFVWEEVCKNIQEWIQDGKTPVMISVNVSMIDILVTDVPDIFRKLLERYEILPKYLAVEITESAYAKDFEVVNEVVKELQEIGLTVLMDDFGSGYSSLNMLKDVSVDILKMDMKFLDIAENSDGRGINIVESVIRLANMMDMRLIAEGVETQEQVDYLSKMGCTYGQGFYFYSRCRWKN